MQHAAESAASQARGGGQLQLPPRPGKAQTGQGCHPVRAECIGGNSDSLDISYLLLFQTLLFNFFLHIFFLKIFLFHVWIYIIN